MEQTVQNGVRLPDNDIGYRTSKEERKESYYKTESHIYNQNLLSGVKAGAHKLSNDIFTYFPKGFQGSKNSDFYEYLSLGMVPYIIGSALLIGLYSAANKHYNAADKQASNLVAKTMGAGVVLYGVGKWLFQKIAHGAIKASTGIDLDMRYINKVNELPEPGQEKGLVREQYPGVYDSVVFFRNDLLAADGEISHDNVYYWDDKITKKAGFDKNLYAPNQIANDKIRKVIARTKALENVGKYIFAATGVALGNQEAFKNLGNFAKKIPASKIKPQKPGDIPFKDKLTQILKNNRFTKFFSGAFGTIKDAFVQLWKGNDKNFVTKNYGKALITASLLSAFLTWLIPTANFKHKAETIKTKINTDKEYEVC